MKFTLNRVRKLAMPLALALLACLPGVAQTPDAKEAAFRRVSNRLMCQCGTCNYMVLSCNHLDCPSSTVIRKEIRAGLDRGESEEMILASFVEDYGPRILVEPERKGFSLMAWVMPFLALGIGGGVVTFVLWRWKAQTAAAAQTAGSGQADELLSRWNAPAAQDPAAVEKYREQINRELDD